MNKVFPVWGTFFSLKIPDSFSDQKAFFSSFFFFENLDEKKHGALVVEFLSLPPAYSQSIKSL